MGFLCLAGPNRGNPPTENTDTWATGQTVTYWAGDDGNLQQGVHWPSPRFDDNGNGTVTDNLTGLGWMKDPFMPGPSSCTPGVEKTWQEALDYVKCLNNNSYLGFSDWRLPNIKELFSLIDRSRHSPALPAGHPFGFIENVAAGLYLSSTTQPQNTSMACFVGVEFGEGNFLHKGTRAFAWPVRVVNVPDTTGPSLSIGSHSDGQHVDTSTIILSGTASDSGTGNNGIQQVTVNGVHASNDTATGSGTANWSKAVSLNPGANPITVIVYDDSSNHNQTSQSITIYYDAPAGTLQFSSATYSVNENGGSATITVTRTGGSSGAVGVSYTTSNGTATAGSDYTSTSGTLSWANGDTSNKTFSIPITNDSIYGEGNETVNLTLSNPTGGATLGSPSTAVLTIVDAADTTPPSAPKNLRIVGYGSIIFAWDPNSEPDLAGYRVHYGPASGPPYGTSIDVGNVTSYTLTGISGGQTYFIAVTAYDTSNNGSGYSNQVSGAASDSMLIQLKSGWNLVSFPNLLQNTLVTDLLSSISGQYESVYAFKGCDTADPWKIYDPTLPPYANDLQYVDSPTGIWISMKQDTELNVSGTFSSTTSISLCIGSNLVSYTGSQAKPLAEALSSISGKYDKVYGYKASDTSDPWKIYNPTLPPYANDLTTIEPGFGYWINVTENCTLVVNN